MEQSIVREWGRVGKLQRLFIHNGVRTCHFDGTGRFIAITALQVKAVGTQRFEWLGRRVRRCQEEAVTGLFVRVCVCVFLTFTCSVFFLFKSFFYVTVDRAGLDIEVDTMAWMLEAVIPPACAVN